MTAGVVVHRSACALTAALLLAVGVHGQGISVVTSGDMLHVRAPALRFFEGRALADLRDGRAVRASVGIELLAARGGAVLTRAAQDFDVSFDLWEERFAVTRVGAAPKSVSHLTTSAAEAWCLENVPIPLAGIAPDRRGSIWVKITVRTRPEAAPGEARATSFGIPNLVDALSRRADREHPPRIVEGGPFRVGS